MATKAKTANSAPTEHDLQAKLAGVVAEAEQAAPAPKGQDSESKGKASDALPSDYDANYAAQQVKLPGSAWARLRRTVTTLAGFGSKVRTPKAPVLSIARGKDSARNGRLWESSIVVPVQEAILDGLTARFDKEGRCVGGIIRVEPTDGREFQCLIPTTHGSVHAYTAKAKLIEIEFTPATDQDGRFLIDPDTLNQTLADRNVGNMHQALASLMGVEYRPEPR